MTLHDPARIEFAAIAEAVRGAGYTVAGMGIETSGIVGPATPESGGGLVLALANGEQQIPVRGIEASALHYVELIGRYAADPDWQRG